MHTPRSPSSLVLRHLDSRTQALDLEIQNLTPAREDFLLPLPGANTHLCLLSEHIPNHLGEGKGGLSHEYLLTGINNTPGFPGGSDGKESTCIAGDLGWEGGHGNPLQYSWLENPMDRGA